MGIDIVIRRERGDVVIRLENTGHENSSMSPRPWVELLAMSMCTGYLGSRCGVDSHCLGGYSLLRVLFSLAGTEDNPQGCISSLRI